MQKDTSFQEYRTLIASTIKNMRDFEAKRLFRRVTNHASRGQEVRDEVRARDRAPQTARSAVVATVRAISVGDTEYRNGFEFIMILCFDE